MCVFMVPGPQPTKEPASSTCRLEEMEINANVTFMKNNKKTNFTLNRL
jgi:hypothetical protein